MEVNAGKEKLQIGVAEKQQMVVSIDGTNRRSSNRLRKLFQRRHCQSTETVMAGLFEDILTNLQEKKQEGKISRRLSL